MKKYCLDTSGLSNPLQHMPEDIHQTLWRGVCSSIDSGCAAVTTEIYDELTHLIGGVKECIVRNKNNLVLEIGQGSWDWKKFLDTVEDMKNRHESFISEYNGGRKGTIGLNDLSIIALAKTLNLPVLSMESRVSHSKKDRRIPDICDIEKMTHWNFSEFLRAEKIQA